MSAKPWRHPMTSEAFNVIRSLFLDRPKYALAVEVWSSVAIEDGDLGKTALETIRRLRGAEPVGERYVLGLALAIRDLDL